MTAKQQALLGVIGGVLITTVSIIIGLTDRSALWPTLAIGIPMGIIYGFGYAFSWEILKKWLSSAAGASGTIAFWAIISQLLFRRGLFLGLIICIFLIAGAIGLAYLPGIFIGIRRIWRESQGDGQQPFTQQQGGWTKTQYLILVLFSLLIFTGFILFAQMNDTTTRGLGTTPNPIPQELWEKTSLSNTTSFKGKYYKVFNSSEISTVDSWEAASRFCQKHYGQLAIIESTEENTFIYAWLQRQNAKDVYFGLTDKNSEGIWRSLTKGKATYLNWAPGEPNNEFGREHYVLFYHRSPPGFWNDGTPGKNFLFICQWDNQAQFKAYTESMKAKAVLLDLNSGEALKGETEAQERGRRLREQYLAGHSDKIERIFFEGMYEESTNVGGGLDIFASIRDKHELAPAMFILSNYQSSKERERQRSRFVHLVKSHLQNFKNMAQKGNPEAINIYGVMLDYTGQKEEALRQYKLAMEKGSEFGRMNYAAHFLMAKDANPESRKKGFALLKESASHGFPRAQDLLSYCYYNGIGTSKNPYLAFYWAREAATQGNKVAMAKLAKFYAEGYGTAINSERSKHWEKKAK